MTSIHQNMNDFLAAAQKTGLLEEMQADLEARNQARRVEIVAAIKALPKESETEMPKLAKAAAEATNALEKARSELVRATAAHGELLTRCYGTQLAFDAKRITLENELKELVPEEISRAHADLYYLDDAVSQKIRYSMVSINGWFTLTKEEVSNLAEVNKVRDEIKAAMARLIEMTFEATATELMRSEVEKICGRIQQRTFELGVDQQEFNRRHSQSAMDNRAADTIEKKRLKRSNQIASIGG